MAAKSLRTPALAAVVLAVMVAGGVSAEVADRSGPPGDFDPALAPPPWKHRCRIAIAAYEDGSASLYCGRRRRSFARIDAESGRIRMRRPPRDSP
jgi:hypothetical protein